MQFLSPPCRKQPPGRIPTCRTIPPPTQNCFDHSSHRSISNNKASTPAVAPFGSAAFFCLATPTFAKSKGEYHG